MTILFSVISRGTTILAKCATCPGNFMEVVELILPKIGLQDSKLTYTHGDYLFHYVTEAGVVYLCITDDVSCIHHYWFVSDLLLALLIMS